jgi:hypothetical protein
MSNNYLLIVNFPYGLGPFSGLFLGCTSCSLHSTPIGVGPLIGPSPGCTWGYSYYLAPLVTSFQPLRGWGPHRPFPRLHLGLLILSRSARYFVSTPTGLGPFSGLSLGCTSCSLYSTPTGLGPFSGLPLSCTQKRSS